MVRAKINKRWIGPSALPNLRELATVLEGMTVALRAPEQMVISVDAQQMVGVIEKLVLALNPPRTRDGRQWNECVACAEL